MFVSYNPIDTFVPGAVGEGQRLRQRLRQRLVRARGARRHGGAHLRLGGAEAQQ